MARFDGLPACPVNRHLTFDPDDSPTMRLTRQAAGVMERIMTAVANAEQVAP